MDLEDAPSLPHLLAAAPQIMPSAPPPPCADQLSHQDNAPLTQLISNVHDLRPVGTLGRGNMGTVLLVVTKHSSTPFALKITRKHASKKLQRSQRTDMEREILSTLHHPFLQTLHGHFESDKHSLLVIDFCSGGDLNVLRQRQPEKRFSETATRFYAAEVLAALEHLHKLGIVYRDLKPENILVEGSGHIKLTDFDLSLKLKSGVAAQAAGAANCLQQQQEAAEPMVQDGPPKQRNRWASLACFRDCLITREEKEAPEVDKPKRNAGGDKVREDTPESVCFVGTDEYVAPEVLRGGEHGFAMDWWSFGVFLYEMIYGSSPFKGSTSDETLRNIMEREPEFPGMRTPAKHLIGQLLVKEPSRRLGFVRGADDIKCHPFFRGLQWECLPHVCRPPFIPPPFNLSEFEERAKRKQLQLHLTHNHASKAWLIDDVVDTIAEESSLTQSSSSALMSSSADSPDEQFRRDENLEEIFSSAELWSSELDAQR